MFLERGIQVSDISPVMLPVMNLHRSRIDVRLERCEVVRELGKFMRHASSTWAPLYWAPQKGIVHQNSKDVG
jgi:hypothetical protein